MRPSVLLQLLLATGAICNQAAQAHLAPTSPPWLPGLFSPGSTEVREVGGGVGRQGLWWGSWWPRCFLCSTHHFLSVQPPSAS